MRQSDKEEVEVEEELELLVEHDRQKGDDIVLLIANDVGWKFALQLLCRALYNKYTGLKESVPGGLKGMVRDLSLLV